MAAWQGERVNFQSSGVPWSRRFKITAWHFCFLIIKEKRNKANTLSQESRETLLIVTTLFLDFSSSL